MRMGPVHLRVNDLERLIPFYKDLVGLQVHSRTAEGARMGAGGEDLLVLHEDKSAKRFQNAANIYHFAIHMVDRTTFARAVARLIAKRWPNSPTDHLVSETTYLEDPEGNTVELTYETPDRGYLVQPVNAPPFWRTAEGGTHSGRDPIDVRGLLQELQEGDDLASPLPKNTKIHHVHLYGTKFEPMDHFYREVMGFRKNSYLPNWQMYDYGPEGYPVHLLAFNTWKGPNTPPKPPGSLGLDHFTVVMPSEKDLSEAIERGRKDGQQAAETEEGWRLKDPSGLELVLRT